MQAEILIRFFFYEVPEDFGEFSRRFAEASWLEQRYLKILEAFIKGGIITIFGSKK